MDRINVAPVPGGWVVDSSLIDNALFFLSGAQAERAARRLARAAAALDMAVALEVRARDGYLVLSDAGAPEAGFQGSRSRDGGPSKPRVEFEPGR